METNLTLFIKRLLRKKKDCLKYICINSASQSRNYDNLLQQILLKMEYVLLLQGLQQHYNEVLTTFVHHESFPVLFCCLRISRHVVVIFIHPCYENTMILAGQVSPGI